MKRQTVTATADPNAVLPAPRDIDAFLSCLVRLRGYDVLVTGEWRVYCQGNGFIWEKVR